jgi:hypothetical protein
MLGPQVRCGCVRAAYQCLRCTLRQDFLPSPTMARQCVLSLLTGRIFVPLVFRTDEFTYMILLFSLLFFYYVVGLKIVKRVQQFTIRSLLK